MRKKIKLLTSNLKMFNTDSGSSLPGMLADVNKFISKQQTNIPSCNQQIINNKEKVNSPNLSNNKLL